MIMQGGVLLLQGLQFWGELAILLELLLQGCYRSQAGLMLGLQGLEVALALVVIQLEGLPLGFILPSLDSGRTQPPLGLI